MDLDVGQDHGTLRGREQGGGLVERLAQGLGVARRQPLGRPVRLDLPGEDLVPRQLEIHRPLVPDGRLQHPVDLLQRGLGLVQHGRGDRDLLEDLELRLESLDLVMEQGVMRPLRQPGRAAQHDHRRLLGVRPRDAVAGAQPAHAVRHADAAQAVDPRIGVGREPRVVLSGHPHQPDRALLDQLVQLEDVVAGYAEDVLDPQGAQPVDQVLADRRHRRSGRGRRLRRSIPRRCRRPGAGPRPFEKCSPSMHLPWLIVNGGRPGPASVHPSGRGGLAPSGATADCRRKPRRDNGLALSSPRGGRAPGRPLPRGRAGSPAPGGPPGGRILRPIRHRDRPGRPGPDRAPGRRAGPRTASGCQPSRSAATGSAGIRVP